MPLDSNYNVAPAGAKPWRGPYSALTNWLLVAGLRRYGYRDHAERIRAEIVDAVRAWGFRRYFDPHEARGLGSERTTRTAALFLDLVYEESEA